MKNILLLNDIMHGGGAERSMAILANELAKTKNYNIILCSIENKFGYELDESIKTTYLRQKFYFGKLHKLFALFIDWFALQRLIKKNDIQVVLSFQNRSNFTNILSRIFGVKYRSIISERVYTKDYYSKGLVSAFMNFLVKTLYKKADFITCNAEDIKNGLIAFYGVKKEKIAVINNAYDTDKILTLANEELESEFKKLFHNKMPTILNIGRLQEQKGQIFLIKALAKMQKKARLVFLGDGALKDELLRLCCDLKIENRVHFLGFQNNPYKFLKNADLFVFPSLYEGYPNALSEAIILNKKIVSFDFLSGSYELIDDYENGVLVKKGDIDELANKMDLMLEKELKNGANLEKFNIQTLKNKYIKVIEDE